MANDGHVKIGTELDESGLKKGLSGLSGSIKSSLSGLGSFAQKGFSAISTGVTAATAAVGAAAAGMAALTTQAIQEYADYEQLVGGVDTLFKESADTVIKYADDAYKTAGMSANEYMDTVTSFSASLLQSLDQDTAEAAEKANQAITDMSDNANKMGSDMQMIQNAYQGFAKQNYTMLDNLKLGYGGTKEEMQRLLDDATALSGIKYDISSFADIVDAIHVVQTEMGITGTTAKEASSTISGSINSMKSAWKNFLTGMADENADFGKLVDNLVDSALTVLDNLAPRIVETIPRLASGIGELAGQAVSYLPQIVGPLLSELVDTGVSMMDSLAQGIAGNLPSIAAFATEIINTLDIGLGQALHNLSSSIPEIISQIILVIAEALPAFTGLGLQILNYIAEGLAESLPSLISQIGNAIYDTLYVIYEYFPSFIEAGGQIISSLLSGLVSSVSFEMPNIIGMGADILTWLMTGITENAGALISQGVIIVTNFVTGIANALPGLLTAAVEMIVALALSLTDPSNLAQIIQAGLNLIVQLIAGIAQAIPLLFEAAPTIISNLVVAVIQSIPLLASAALQIMTELGVMLIKYVGYLITVIPNIITQIKDAFANTNWAEVGLNIIEGVKNGIVSAAGRLIDAAVQAAKDAVEAVKGWLGINSPSTLMRDLIGKNMVAGIAVGIEDGTRGMVSSASKSVKKLVDGMQAASSTAYPEFRTPRTGGGGTDQGPEGSGGVTNNYIFNQPVETPDETARAIRKVNEFGLAGAR